MPEKKDSYPGWFEGELPADCYRSIFRWGDPKEYKHPNRRLYAMMKKVFKMTDEDFNKPVDLGLDPVVYDIPVKLTASQLEQLGKITGAENIRTDAYTRLATSYAKGMYDSIRLREKIIENVPDAVLYPGSTEEIQQIVQFCSKEKIPLYVYGGGSSVTRGPEAVEGGITLDIRKRFNKIIKLNPVNETVTVQPGISGPDLEAALQDAKKRFGTKHNYTCGHFPQSFEYSVVGGWVVTRGAGQNSTYYGKIENIVISQEYVTPVGTIKTLEYPAKATGPDIDQIMIGSEGAFGILVSATLKLRRWMPENTRRFSFIFKNWADARNALREIMQTEAGLPSVCRLSDPEETDIALKLYGVEGTILDTLIRVRGFKQGERCLFLGTADGSKAYTKMVYRNVRRICRRYGALFTTSYVTRQWEKDRFRDPYLKDDLQDYKIIIDTMECSVNWEKLEHIYNSVRKFYKARPNTINMTHISHCYPQGCNLYFIFISKFENLADFKEYQNGILDAIQASGATMSHHHGIGKLFGPWIEGQIGKNEYEVFKVLKRHFDPDNIMNPGGTLGFDLPESVKRGKPAQ